MNKLVTGSYIKYILLLFCPLFGKAQNDSALVFKAVVTVDSATKYQLFDRARTWFADYYKNSKALLQISDRESGELMGKPIISTTYNYRYFGADHKTPLDINATIRVVVKDGKYKYEIYDLYDSYLFGAFTTENNCPKKLPMTKQSKADGMWRDAKNGIEKEVNSIAASLNKYMKKNSGIIDNF